MDKHAAEIIKAHGWTITPSGDDIITITIRTKMGIELTMRTEDTPASVAQAAHNYIAVIGSKAVEAIKTGYTLRAVKLNNAEKYVRELFKALSPWHAPASNTPMVYNPRFTRG